MSSYLAFPDHEHDLPLIPSALSPSNATRIVANRSTIARQLFPNIFSPDRISTCDDGRSCRSSVSFSRSVWDPEHFAFIRLQPSICISDGCYQSSIWMSRLHRPGDERECAKLTPRVSSVYRWQMPYVSESLWG